MCGVRWEERMIGTFSGHYSQERMWVAKNIVFQIMIQSFALESPGILVKIQISGSQVRTLLSQTLRSGAQTAVFVTRPPRDLRQAEEEGHTRQKTPLFLMPCDSRNGRLCVSSPFFSLVYKCSTGSSLFRTQLGLKWANWFLIPGKLHIKRVIWLLWHQIGF